MKFLIFVTLAILAVAQAKILMSSSGLFKALESNAIEEEPQAQTAIQTEKLYIPMSRYMQCSDGGCNAVCQVLGYRYGRCVSSSTCQCYS